MCVRVHTCAIMNWTCVHVSYRPFLEVRRSWLFVPSLFADTTVGIVDRGTGSFILVTHLVTYLFRKDSLYTGEPKVKITAYCRRKSGTCPITRYSN